MVKLTHVNRRLISAVSKNDLQKVKFLVTSGANVNQFNGRESLLYIAACKGYFDIVKFLLSKNIQIYESSFKIACENGHLDIVKLLVAKGIIIDILYPNFTTRYGYEDYLYYNPLARAYKYDHVSVVEYLLSLGMPLVKEVLKLENKSIQMQELLISKGIIPSLEIKKEINKYYKKHLILFLLNCEKYYKEYKLFDIQVIIFTFKSYILL